MLSAVILNRHSYPAVPLAGTAGTPEVNSSRSSRTREEYPQATTPAADRDQPVSRMWSHILLCALDYNFIL